MIKEAPGRNKSTAPKKQPPEIEDLLSAFYEITNLLIIEADLERTLELILEKIGEKVDATAAAIWVWDEKEKYFRNVACYNWPKEFEARAITTRLKGGAVGKAVSTKKPYLMKNAWTDPTLPKKYLATTKKTGIKAFFCFPLIVRGEAFGSFNIYFSRFREDVSEQEVMLFSVVANQIAALIENVQVYKKLQAEFDKMNKMYKLTVGRELKMAELKEENKGLKEEIKRLRDIISRAK